MFSLSSFARRATIAVAAMSISVAVAPSALAAPPTIPTLNPAPADYYSCRPDGGGTICRALTSTPYGPDPTGIVCGSGANAFEVLDSATRVIRATRWYDADGNLVRRHRVFEFEGATLTNPRTGATLPYHQLNSDWEQLGVPGDLASATYIAHGVLQFTAPGMGTVWHDSGSTVTGPDGTVLHHGGPSEVTDYFATGDPAIVADLCAALGA